MVLSDECINYEEVVGFIYFLKEQNVDGKLLRCIWKILTNICYKLD